MRRIVLLGVAVSALAIAAAGCGGGGGSALSKEEYSSRLNTICDELNAKNKEIGEPNSISEVADKGPQLVDAFDGAIAEVKDLNPPDELKDAHNRFVDLGGQLRDKINTLIDAAKENNQDEINKVGAEIDPLQTESDNLARNTLGAPACAEG